MKLCWLIADDKGGGIVSVALSCARQAAVSGHMATILLLTRSTGWLGREPLGGVHLHSLECEPNASESPGRIIEWLELNPQQYLFINGVGEFDDAIGYVSQNTRVIYVVHDTAWRYWRSAVRSEQCLDAVVAVSEVVAAEFRRRLAQPDKLRVLWNGSYFPPAPEYYTGRKSDLLFCGGDNPRKGAGDVMRLWRRLVAEGFDGSLHWFGSLNSDFRANIQRLPSADRIHLYGRCSREQIFSRALECRAFLMLSRVEPFGMVTVEAMSMGCVPVAWDIATGTKEIVPGLGGFATLGDFTALAEVVSEALRMQPNLGALMSEHARSYFSEPAMWTRYAEAISIWQQTDIARRPNSGRRPPPYRSHFRLLQLIPRTWRDFLRNLLAATPRLGYLVRDKRGF